MSVAKAVWQLREKYGLDPVTGKRPGAEPTVKRKVRKVHNSSRVEVTRDPQDLIVLALRIAACCGRPDLRGQYKQLADDLAGPVVDGLDDPAEGGAA